MTVDIVDEFLRLACMEKWQMQSTFDGKLFMLNSLISIGIKGVDSFLPVMIFHCRTRITYLIFKGNIKNNPFPNITIDLVDVFYEVGHAYNYFQLCLCYFVHFVFYSGGLYFPTLATFTRLEDKAISRGKALLWPYVSLVFILVIYVLC